MCDRSATIVTEVSRFTALNVVEMIHEHLILIISEYSHTGSGMNKYFCKYKTNKNDNVYHVIRLPAII